MNRINLFRRTEVRNTANRNTPAKLDSLAWGKINFENRGGAVVFAALLIVCSIAVGCSSDSPKPASSTSQSATQPTPPVTTPLSAPATPALQAEAKPAHKKVARRAPVTLAYADKTTGVSFQYPRKYMLKTGEAADKLVSSDPVPTNFVQPGGVAIAAVAVPELIYPKSDLDAAFFNVSVNKALTEEQCGEFSEAKPAAPVVPATSTDAPTSTTPATPAASAAPVAAQSAKLMIGDMELLSNETLASQGASEEAAKYYHVFENGACYEFALKVLTTGVEPEGGKRVDRKEVFGRLEKILATVKINPAQEVTASAPAGTPAAPAQ
jgi:hypothetical protein